LYAQSFTPSLYSITRIELKIYKTGNPDALKISIRSDLSGEDLTSITILASEISTSLHWHEFNFSNINLTPANKYYIVWSPKGASDQNNTFYWECGNRDRYTEGEAWKFLGLEWEIHNPISVLGLDFCFKTYGLENIPPNTPDVPSGVTTGIIDTEYGYFTYSTDLEDDLISYRFDFGNRITNWTEYTSSGEGSIVSNSWSNPGMYPVKSQAKDFLGATSEWSTPLIVTINSGENNPPDKPSKPSGEISGKTGEYYTYSSNSHDIDGDQIYYWFDWGDGTDTGWKGPYDSGDMITESHMWDIQGTYPIKVKAKDNYDEESAWSDSLSISMPKNKSSNFSPKIVIWLFERFPFLKPYFS